MTIPNLPLELVEVILEHLFGEYDLCAPPVALYKCSLVSQSWRHIAQSIMLSEITLPAFDANNHHVDFDTFKKDPVLLQCVRHLFIMEHNWPEIANILPTFPNLRRIAIIEEILTHTPFQAPVHTFTQVADRLTSIYLGYLYCFPAQIFNHCSSLRELRTLNMNFLFSDLKGSDSDASLNKARLRPRLHLLEIAVGNEDETEILSWFLRPECAFDLSELKTLHILDRTCEAPVHRMAQILVEFVAPTIHDLALTSPTLDETIDHYITPESLSYMKNLLSIRSVRLPVIQYGDDIAKTNPIPWVVAFLSNLPRPEYLERVDIPSTTALETSDEDIQNLDKKVESYGLQMLDSLLSSSKFPTLKRVNFGSAAFAADDIDGPARSPILERLYEARLPHLSERDMLHFVYCKVTDYLTEAECWWALKSMLEFEP
ncbi:hypothetical protein BDN72DRAFT_877983 [Pluteus cervinus]|uniref:Uncharacterized protein n=1 Tax=Pluteus cervinus TaxID=181527 RepID=A0ACD3AWY9_9AGAR|nr:hypothetical protein BDN72DRAFT_877983 [Pluteus cervinus]